LLTIIQTNQCEFLFIKDVVFHALCKHFRHVCKTTKITVREMNNKQMQNFMHRKFTQLQPMKKLPKLKAEQIGIEAGSDTTCKHNLNKMLIK